MQIRSTLDLPLKFNIIRRLRARWRLHKSRRFLARYNCISYKSWKRLYDPRINIRAHYLREYYYGYARISLLCTYAMWMNRDLMNEWCNKNCKGYWRSDVLRMSNSNYPDDYYINDFGDCDYVCFAFTDERDFIIFSLKWL